MTRATQADLAQVLEQVFGDRVRYDRERDRIVCAGIDRSLGYFPDGDWSSEHTTAAMILIERRGLLVSARAADRAIAAHARQHEKEPLKNVSASRLEGPRGAVDETRKRNELLTHET